MKYTSEKVFIQSLQAVAAKTQLFLVFSSDDFERSYFCHKIAEKKSFSTVKKIFAENVSIPQIIESVFTPSLFSENALYFLDPINTMKKGDLIKVSTLLEKSSLMFPFVLASATNLSSVSKIVEKRDGLVLDLLSEKPWEKKQRLIDFAIFYASTKKKILGYSQAHDLLQKTGLHMAAICNEIDKLITFIHPRERIEKDDIENICFSLDETTLWQVAEEIVWGTGKKDYTRQIQENNAFFYGLIGAIRYQLQVGLKMASVEPGSSRNLLPHIGRMPQKVLESKMQKARIRKDVFFKKALIELFEMEIKAKNNIKNLPMLFDLFLVKGCFYA